MKTDEMFDYEIRAEALRNVCLLYGGSASEASPLLFDKTLRFFEAYLRGDE